MNQLPSVSKIKEFFLHHRIERVKTFLLLCASIQSGRSVNLKTCARQTPKLLNDKAIKIDNIYTRFIRFFKMEQISLFCLGIAVLILNSIEDVQKESYVLLDRTTWKLGGQYINILQLGLGLANYSMVPLLAVPLLNKKGNSNQKERIGLLNLFLSLCPHLSKDSIIIGDREFIGRDWFKHIMKQNRHLVFRVRQQDYLEEIAKSIDKSVKKLERKIQRKVKANGFYYQEFEMDGHTLYYLVFRDSSSKKGKVKYVRLVSNLNDVKRMLAAYTYRWEIEVYFRKTKTDGYNLEELNFTDPNKIMLMATIVGYLYTLTLMEGIKQNIRKPQKMQFFISNKKKYIRVSCFTQGLDIMAKNIFKLSDLIRHIKAKIKKKKILPLKIVDLFKDGELPYVLTQIKSV